MVVRSTHPYLLADWCCCDIVTLECSLCQRTKSNTLPGCRPCHCSSAITRVLGTLCTHFALLQACVHGVSPRSVH
jgi:hypothetical protein